MIVVAVVSLSVELDQLTLVVCVRTPLRCTLLVDRSSPLR